MKQIVELSQLGSLISEKFDRMISPGKSNGVVIVHEIECTERVVAIGSAEDGFRSEWKKDLYSPVHRRKRITEEEFLETIQVFDTPDLLSYSGHACYEDDGCLGGESYYLKVVMAGTTANILFINPRSTKDRFLVQLAHDLDRTLRHGGRRGIRKYLC